MILWGCEELLGCLVIVDFGYCLKIVSSRFILLPSLRGRGWGWGFVYFIFLSTPQGSGGSAFYATGTEGYYLVPQSPGSDV